MDEKQQEVIQEQQADTVLPPPESEPTVPVVPPENEPTVPVVPPESEPAVPVVPPESEPAVPVVPPESEPAVSPMPVGGENPYARFRNDNTFLPPAPITLRPAGSRMTRVFLWIITVILVAGAAFLTMAVLGRNRNAGEDPKDSKIPYNGNAASSYAAEISLPEAPDVSADPDGPQISTQETESISPNAVHAAFEKASPSIVCVTSYLAGGDFMLSKFGDGSGIILTKDGYIATNSHVVNDSTSTGVLVTLNDGRQFLGTIIGLDKKTDLAVLRISADDLQAAEFADSDKLFVGQDVYAIGNPGGTSFTNSLTKGTVSAVNRILASKGYTKYIQTDAAINPGNSGGALVNENGQVVGMNTSKIVSTDYEGMGFSIPSNKVTEIVNKLIKYGFVNDRGTLGITGKTCNLYESRKNNVPQGMVITDISENSPLQKTEVARQDIITEVNGVTVTSTYECIEELSKYKPGDSVTLKLFRVAGSSSRAVSFEVTVQLADDRGD